MRMNFLSGLVAGVLLATALVVGSGYSSTATTGGPMVPVAGIVQYSSSTSTTVTSAASATTQSVTSASTPALQSSLNSVPTTTTNSSAGFVTNGAAQSSVHLTFGPAVQVPSSLATIISRPLLIPLLLVPVLVALALGIALYIESKEKD